MTHPRPWTPIAVLTLAGILCVWRSQPVLHGQVEVSKLSGVLADLAGAVGQQPTTAGPSLIAQPLALDSMPKSVQDSIGGSRLRVNARGEVQVYVLMTAVTPENDSALVAAGASIEIEDAPHRRVQARVPASRLQAVAALPFVTFVRPPTYARVHIGSVTTEGDALHNADVARQQFSVDGTGVRIGVISDGLKGVFASGCTTCSGAAGGPIASGNLPNAVGTRSSTGVLTSASGRIVGRSFQANGDLEGLPPASPACGFAGAGAEGTALLEIVHDVAPGAQLSFANGDTDLAFSQAVTALAATNDVVVDDVGFFGEPYDGTSAVSSNTASALNGASNPIRAYVTAVGNEADEHYFGTYTDSGIDGSTLSGVTHFGHLHLFRQSADTTDVLGLGPQPYNLVFLPRGGEIVIFLSWDDPFGASSNNYDLYLVQQSTGRIVARSTDTQNGGQDPVEVIDFVNGGTQDFFRIAVQNVFSAAQPRHLNLYSYQPECAIDGPRVLAAPHHDRHNYNTASRSVAAQGDAGGSPAAVVSVGAICSGSATAAALFPASLPDESCNDRTHTTAEFFSSRGPTLDGRIKPDIAAVDGVSVTGAGGFSSPFFGSSAAAPHVAAIAGLLLQASPCLLASGNVDADTARVRLRNVLLSSAQPLSSGSPDNTFGAGFADALAAIQRTLPALKSAQLIVGGNTPLGAGLSGAQLGFTDPDGCSVTRLSWTGGCGTSPASSMNCPFGTTRVNVAASNNGGAFSPPSDLQITVTSFSIGAAPGSLTVSAGQSGVLSTVVGAVGGAFGAPVSLACTNLPPGTSCTFNPPTVVPGTGSASSTLTIATTSRNTSSEVSTRPGAPPMRAMAVMEGLMLFSAFTLLTMRPGRAMAGSLLMCVLIAAHAGCGGGRGGTSTGSSSSSSGTSGSSAPAASLAPSSLDLGVQTVGTASAPQTVTLTNAGSAALTVGSISATGDFAQTSNCGGSLASGAGCQIRVSFTPTSAGSRAGALTVSDNAAGSPQSVALSGTGEATRSGGGSPVSPGSYQIGIAGQSGTLVQSTTVTLVVQ